MEAATRRAYGDWLKGRRGEEGGGGGRVVVVGGGVIVEGDVGFEL